MRSHSTRVVEAEREFPEEQCSRRSPSTVTSILRSPVVVVKEPLSQWIGTVTQLRLRGTGG